MDDKIVCEICKKSFRRITRTHLKTHGITTKEYMLLYPDSEIICNSLRHECGKFFRENPPMHNPIYKEMIASAHRGRPKTEDHKRKLSESQRGENHHMWGKKRPAHSELMKKIMPDIMKNLYSDGRPGNNKGKKLNLSAEQRLAASERQKGQVKWPNGNPNKGKKLNLSDEQRLNRSLKSSNWLKQHVSKSKDTDIEIKFKEWCISNDIGYEHQFLLIHKNTTWLFDFYIPTLNMLVELDGEYWHSNKKQINRDMLKEQNALANGFNFCRISSLDLNFSIMLRDLNTISQHNRNIIARRLSKHSIVD